MDRRTSFLSGALVLLTVTTVQPQQPRDQSATTATVALDDGATLELHDFGLYSAHRTPAVYMRGGKSSRDQDLLVKSGRFWTAIPMKGLKSLQRRTERTAEIRDLSGVDIVLESAEQIAGEVPTKCVVTWLECDGFEFDGKASVLGTSAEFSIGVNEVKSITRGQGPAVRYDVTDTSGTVTSVEGLVHRSYSTPPSLYVRQFAFTRVTERGSVVSAGQPFAFVVGRSTVRLKLEQIESVLFPVKINDNVHLRLRTGEEADGLFSAEDEVTRGFGRMADGRIWFESLFSSDRRSWAVKSITFGPLKSRS